MQVEISDKLLRVLRGLAKAQGRSEEAVLEEAMNLYLHELGASFTFLPELFEKGDEADIGRMLDAVYAMRRAERPHDPFLALIDRMSSRFDFDEDEAMRIAVEEQHAFRRERGGREKADR